jgi:hypothetical protein
MEAVSELSTGTIVGRFVYTSRGSQGWGVADEVGQVPPEVMRQALSAVERLSEPTELLEPAPNERARRMVWGGEPGAPWRYLFNTVSAGDDASRRPHNNITDCLVVRRNDTGHPGCEPARLWGSRGWLTPYGSEAVSGIDLHPDDTESLVMPLDDAGEPLVTLALAAATNNEPSFLYSVASLVAAIAQGVGSPSRRTAVAVVEDVDFAPIFLGAAASVLPFDVAWDLPVEVRSVALTAAPPHGGGIIAMTREAALDCDGVEVLDLGGEAPAPRPAPRGACSGCDVPVESWGSLVSQCVIGLAAASASPGVDPVRVQRLAQSLVMVMRQASALRISGAALPTTCFTEAALTSSGNLDVAELFDAHTAWDLLSVDHRHQPVIPSPQLPTLLPGTALIQDPGMRTRTMMRRLAHTRPGVAGFWQADWLIGKNRRAVDHWIVAAHRALGRPGLDHMDRIETYCELRLDHPEFAAIGSRGRVSLPLIDYCADIFMADLVTAMVEEKQHRLPLGEGMDATAIATLAESLERPTWPLGLLDPRASRFVTTWLHEKPRRGYPAELAGEIVNQHPLAYTLLNLVVPASDDDPVPLLFLRDALVEAVRRPYRNAQFRGLPEALMEQVNRRLARLTFQPPAPAGGSRA